MSCEDCKFFKVYRGARDRYGMQLDPDDSECVGRASEADLEKYFVEAEDGAEDCNGFECRYKEAME